MRFDSWNWVQERVHKSLALECKSASFPVADHETQNNLERDSNIIVSALEKIGMEPEPEKVREALESVVHDLHLSYRDNLAHVLFDALSRSAEEHTNDGLV